MVKAGEQELSVGQDNTTLEKNCRDIFVMTSMRQDIVEGTAENTMVGSYRDDDSKKDITLAFR